MRYFWGYLDTESEVILRIIGPIYWIFEIVVDVGKSWIGMECNKDKKKQLDESLYFECLYFFYFVLRI